MRWGCIPLQVASSPPPLFHCESPIAPDISLFIYAASSRYSLPDLKLAPALLISPSAPLECAYLEDKAANDLQRYLLLFDESLKIFCVLLNCFYVEITFQNDKYDL